MTLRLGSTLVRGLLLLLAVAAALGTAWHLAAFALRPVWTAWRRGGPEAVASLPFPEALTALCAAAVLGCVVWGAAGAVLALSALIARRAAPTGRTAAALGSLADRLSPAVVRNGVALAVGAALTVGIAGPATAVPADTPGRAAGAATAALAGLPVPDRVPGGAAPARLVHRPAAPAHGPVAGRVVVAPGDSLWSLAAARLPDDAPAARVAALAHLIHAANVDRIGPDPDLLHPGTVLRWPGPPAATGS